MMPVLAAIRGWFAAHFVRTGGGQASDVPGLRALLSGQASFVAQKLVTEYCQAKAGRHWPQLATEQTFIDALARARWEAFAAILADVVVIAEGILRPAAGDRRERLLDPLIRLYAGALDAYPRPSHRPEGWGDAVAAFATRLAAAQRAEPQAPRLVAAVGGHRMFETLPIALGMRRYDEPMVINGVAFHLTAMIGRLRRRIDAPAVVGALLAPPD
ncbi:MAG: hypothetical protein IT561_04110 [Alphaproteobacteria bacterium]|nr:hypothetical protein [Alphaproteobacteria bacterium]